MDRSSSRRRFLSALSVLAGAALAGCEMSSPASPTPAAEPPTTRPPGTPGPTWAHVGFSWPVLGLFTPPGGPVFARLRNLLWWSADGSAPWFTVPMPFPVDDWRGEATFAVHPSDHRIIYGAWKNGVHRTDDGGATWTQLMTPKYGGVTFAISPADPQVIYLFNASSGSDGQLLRSDDGGNTWSNIRSERGDTCHVSTLILAAHPKDRNRIHMTAGCYAGRNRDDSLEESTDRGHTWAQRLRAAYLFPMAISGGDGIVPTRWYLGANHGFDGNGGEVFQSPDDGLTWTSILKIPLPANGGTGAVTQRIGGVAYDPNAPDRVFVALTTTRQASASSAISTSGIITSSDGGASWSELGNQDLPGSAGLHFDPTRRVLFAATQRGLWRLPIG